MSGSTAPASGDVTIEELLERAGRATALERARLHDEAVERSLGLARSLAARYASRGESMDDLMQVACIGLINAVRRYRPDAGAGFAAFATPTILGELRRHFRDHAWAIRPPRRVQETLPLMRAARAELEQRHSRPPSVAQLAHQLEMPEADVRELEQAASQYSLASLESIIDSGVALPPAPIDDIHLVIDRLAVHRLLRELPERERTIIYLRFYEELTQARIGDVFGQSQMQISRSLTAILARLRKEVVAESAATEIARQPEAG